MFKLFKSDPTSKIQKEYENVLGQAMQAQRSGDIKRYSELSVQADALYEKLSALKQDQD